jgi:hypothetical protein
MGEPNNDPFPNMNDEFEDRLKSTPLSAKCKIVNSNRGFDVSECDNPIFRGKYLTQASIPVKQSSINSIFLQGQSGNITYANNLYNKIGNYTGNTSTQTITGENIRGEWIQITLPYKVLIDVCRCVKDSDPINNYSKPSADEIALLGSNDSLKWTLLKAKKHSTKPYYFIESNTEFNTYRCVITKGLRTKGVRTEGFTTEEFTTEEFTTEGFTEAWRPRFNIRPRGKQAPISNNVKIGKIGLYGSYPKINLAGQTITTDGFSNIEGLGMMANETQLLNDLNVFNAAYGSYVEHCKGLTSKRWTDPSCNDLSGNVMTSYNKIATFNGGNVLTGGSLFEVQNSFVTNYVSREVADASFNSIKTKHKDIMKMRSELDVKLKELNAADGSFTQEQKRIFDGTVYTSVIWTVLATTTLYYVFKNI